MEFFVLLVVYQLKHFLADYPLQNSYMLKKFLGGRDWILPLATHAGVHAVFTFVISAVYLQDLTMLSVALAAVDFVCHFVMDRVKASPKLMGRWKTVSADEYRSLARMASYDGTNGELQCGRQMAERKLKSNTYFWWALGIDQMIHHLTHYAIIFFLILGKNWG